jgi:hypothetical protein
MEMANGGTFEREIPNFGEGVMGSGELSGHIVDRQA